jgi:hypothetical protein
MFLSLFLLRYLKVLTDDLFGVADPYETGGFVLIFLLLNPTLLALPSL